MAKRLIDTPTRNEKKKLEYIERYQYLADEYFERGDMENAAKYLRWAEIVRDSVWNEPDSVMVG